MNPSHRVFPRASSAIPPPFQPIGQPLPTSIAYQPSSGIPIPQSTNRLPQLPLQSSQTYQPVFVIPITTASNPIDPLAVDLSKSTRPISIPTIAPKPENPVSSCPTSTSALPRGRRSIPPVDDRELRRRVKKQNMERRRRACISDKLTALHSLAVSLIGEKPQQQNHQRTEITDMLNQCVTVLQGISDFVKSEPELQARMHRIGLRSTGALEDQKRRKRAIVNELSAPQDESNKENIPRVSAFTPVVGRLNPPSVPSTFTQHSVTPRRKRESVDSGLDVGFTSGSFSSPSNSSAGPFDTPPVIPPFKKPRNPQSNKIWRPYQD